MESPARASLEVQDVSCRRTGDYFRVVGRVKNVGSTTVNWVKVTVTLTDSSGSMVDTSIAYAAGSEFIRPGESGEFSEFSSHPKAVRCRARIKNYEVVR